MRDYIKNMENQIQQMAIENEHLLEKIATMQKTPSPN